MQQNGTDVYFFTDSLSQPRIQGSVLTGTEIDASQRSIPISDIQKIYVKRPSLTATIINISIVSLIVGGFVYLAMTSESQGMDFNGMFSGPL